ncbi:MULTISPECIES: hypothetical protein [unclassified Synechocystis]|uniref:hypothetical protein n=1 Tax=unclassified Synechocystis TaxID=2640012 RepID=UPI00048C0B64|nr:MULTISPECIES: hypothetical protein [unclassified Synechocystis]
MRHSLFACLTSVPNFTRGLGVAIASVSFGVGLTMAAGAETCVPIALVGGEGNSVTKTVAAPTIPAGPLGMLGINITRNNWNTDWAVPGGTVFKRFVMTVTSNETNPFDIRMFLKYSDQTAAEVFNQSSFVFKPNTPLEIIGNVTPEEQPYQVNLFVNGLDSLGRTYTATLVGCR